MIGFIVGLVLFVITAIDFTLNGATVWEWLLAIMACSVIGGIVQGIVVVAMVMFAWIIDGIANLLRRRGA